VRIRERERKREREKVIYFSIFKKSKAFKNFDVKDKIVKI